MPYRATNLNSSLPSPHRLTHTQLPSLRSSQVFNYPASLAPGSCPLCRYQTDLSGRPTMLPQVLLPVSPLPSARRQAYSRILLGCSEPHLIP